MSRIAPEVFFCGNPKVHEGHAWQYGGKWFRCNGITEVHPNERRSNQ